jgi:hypothetical protein
VTQKALSAPPEVDFTIVKILTELRGAFFTHFRRHGYNSLGA